MGRELRHKQAEERRKGDLRDKDRDRDRDRDRGRDRGRGDREKEREERKESSDENLDIEIPSEEEDEEAIIERKRKERAELLAKLKDGVHVPAPQPERPLTPPEVKIAKAIKNELRSDLVAQQFGQIEKQLEQS